VTDIREVQPKNAPFGMDVTVFGMMTSAWQGNGVTVGLIDGSIEGSTEGAMDGATEGAIEGAMDMVGAEVGIREGGPEMHVGRPEPAQAGYTQAEVETKVSIPGKVPAQFSIMTI